MSTTHNYPQRLRQMAREANDRGEPYELVDFLNDCAQYIEQLEQRTSQQPPQRQALQGVQHG